ncbi:MAG: sulfotransferase [Pseudomonadota bacterium]
MSKAIDAVISGAFGDNWATRKQAWRERFGYQIGFISFTRFVNVIRLSRFLPFISPRFTARLGLIVFTALLVLPLNIYQRVRFARRISSARFDESPVFIIGHWRSGTTHLHNLLSQDRQFGTVSMFQALLPECSLVTERWLKPLLARVVPLKRPMDNMTWPMEAPQEEEIPLAKLFPYSFYTQFLFPRLTRKFFRNYVLFETPHPAIEEELRRKYLWLLKVTAVHNGGRRLLLKNPVNTARIPMLLSLFPDAKFIFIHRAPYDVFRSTQSLHAKLHHLTALHETDARSAEETIFDLYRGLNQRYLRDRDSIPVGNLVEVGFDELEQRPRETIERIYAALGIGIGGEARERIGAYINDERDYRKNQFSDDEQLHRRVASEWSFAFDAFGYPRPNVGSDVSITGSDERHRL